MFHRTARVAEHVTLAERTYRVRLECPDVAAAIRPGQFVMLRLPNTTDPLLGRPFALYDTVLDAAGKPVGIDVVYLVVGKMTGRLAEVDVGRIARSVGAARQAVPRRRHAGARHVRRRRDRADAVPGVRPRTARHARLRRRCAAKRTRKVVALLRRAHRDLAAGVDDFRAAGVEVHLASDDGSVGTKGFVTQLLASHGKTGPLVGCGPEPMLHALAKLARAWGVPCQVSLETPMACGVGICFSCVTKVKTPDGWDYAACAWTAPSSTPPVWSGNKAAQIAD